MSNACIPVSVTFLLLAILKPKQSRQRLRNNRGLIASIIRFVGFFNTNAVTDQTWAAMDLTIWTIIETGMYLMAACFPTYRPLVKFIASRRNRNAVKNSDEVALKQTARTHNDMYLEYQLESRDSNKKGYHVANSASKKDSVEPFSPFQSTGSQ